MSDEPRTPQLKDALHLVDAVKLVWRAAPGWTALNAVLAVLQGIVPLLAVYLMKLIVDAVTTGITQADHAAAFKTAAWYILLAAIVGLPPFGVFSSEFLIVSSTFARQPVLAVILVAGLLLAFGALLLRVTDVAFGPVKGPVGRVKASYIPMFAHLALVLTAGIWLPPPLVAWFQHVAVLLG